MKCIINGDAFNFDSERSITPALESLELGPKCVIAERNKTLIKQEDYDQYTVCGDDRLELSGFVGGE